MDDLFLLVPSKLANFCFFLVFVRLIARLARSTDSVWVNFFGFTRPAGKVLTGEINIDLMTALKLQKNVPTT